MASIFLVQRAAADDHSGGKLEIEKPAQRILIDTLEIENDRVRVRHWRTPQKRSAAAASLRVQALT
jgi:hypothetical protein